MLTACAEGRGYGSLQVRVQRWLAENSCVRAAYESTQTEHIQRGGAPGTAPFVLDQTRVLKLEGRQCTLRSDTVGLPAEYEFIVSEATMTANDHRTELFAANTRIFVHTEPQDQLTSSLVTINDQAPTEAQVRFLRNFLVFARPRSPSALSRLDGVREIGARRSYSNTLFWPGFLPRQEVARYRGRISVSRLRVWRGVDVYELVEEARSPATQIDVTGEGMQVHGVLQEEQHARHLQPLDVLVLDMAFDNTVRKTFTGSVLINGQLLSMQSEESIRSKHRFSRPFARSTQP